MNSSMLACWKGEIEKIMLEPVACNVPRRASEVGRVLCESADALVVQDQTLCEIGILLLEQALGANGAEEDVRTHWERWQAHLVMVRRTQQLAEQLSKRKGDWHDLAQSIADWSKAIIRHYRNQIADLYWSARALEIRGRSGGVTECTWQAFADTSMGEQMYQDTWHAWERAQDAILKRAAGRTGMMLGVALGFWIGS